MVKGSKHYIVFVWKTPGMMLGGHVAAKALPQSQKAFQKPVMKQLNAVKK
jgi:hypothetical protein